MSRPSFPDELASLPPLPPGATFDEATLQAILGGPSNANGNKRRLTPQQIELENLQLKARAEMMQREAEAMNRQGMLGAMGVAGPGLMHPRFDEIALAPHMPTMLSALSVAAPPGNLGMHAPVPSPATEAFSNELADSTAGSGGQARRAHLSTCHGALLMGGVEHFVSSAGQRVCPDCQTLCRGGGGGGRGQIFVDRQRVRLLMSPVGVWSKARDFYTRWEALPGLNAHARRFPLAGAQSGASVIVFKSAEQAQLLDGQLGPSGTLLPLTEDPAFTMCSRAKTFCPCCNFASAAARGCVLHSSAMRDQRQGPGHDAAGDGEGSPATQLGGMVRASGASDSGRFADASEERDSGGNQRAEGEEGEELHSAGNVDLTELLGNDDGWGAFLGPLTADGTGASARSAQNTSPPHRRQCVQKDPPGAQDGAVRGASSGGGGDESECPGSNGLAESSQSAPPPQEQAPQQPSQPLQQQMLQMQHLQQQQQQAQQQAQMARRPSLGETDASFAAAPGLGPQVGQAPPAMAAAAPAAAPACNPSAVVSNASALGAVATRDAGPVTSAASVASAVVRQEQREQLASASAVLQQEMEELVSLLPPHYVISTVLQDRLIHLQLFKRLRAQAHASVVSQWAHHTDRSGKQALRLHLLFKDQPGSLAAVAGALSKAGVNILEAAVFCTATGFALDIFTLSAPTPGAAVYADECIREVFPQE